MSGVVDVGEAEAPALTFAREQLAWYDERSRHVRRRFHGGRLAALVVGVAVSVLAGIEAVPRVVLALLGGVLVVLAGVEQLFQWHERWTSYRSTAEALRREVTLYLSSAAAYAGDVERDRTLAERVTLLVGREAGEWAEAQRAQRGSPAPTVAAA